MSDNSPVHEEDERERSITQSFFGRGSVTIADSVGVTSVGKTFDRETKPTGRHLRLSIDDRVTQLT